MIYLIVSNLKIKMVRINKLDIFKCNLYETCMIFVLFCHESIENKIKYLFLICD